MAARSPSLGARKPRHLTIGDHKHDQRHGGQRVCTRTVPFLRMSGELLEPGGGNVGVRVHVDQGRLVIERPDDAGRGRAGGPPASSCVAGRRASLAPFWCSVAGQRADAAPRRANVAGPRGSDGQKSAIVGRLRGTRAPRRADLAGSRAGVAARRAMHAPNWGNVGG